MAFDAVIREIVADKKITLKAAVLDIVTSLGPAIKKAQEDVDKAEAERVAAEAAVLAAEVATARANNSALAEKKAAKRVKLEQEALEEDDHVSDSDNEA
ncbi:hypothetical protein HaLaN_03137 [Haematococcus lacustris]|uniref:Uncharacterized protein n=1 Tax=Haematococcus lacustris TaxID=44745 RepID=A0A699YJV5_HAELA|nr:hypothetical protein HaLaN_03137 [Haematococcus lacustris]